MTDPNGNVTTYAYDALNRRTTMTEPLGHVTSLVYDPVGNLAQKTDPKGQVIGYSYDALNRRTGIDYPAQPDVDLQLRRGGQPHRHERRARHHHPRLRPARPAHRAPPTPSARRSATATTPTATARA